MDGEPGTPGGQRNTRVLLIDDDEAVRSVVRRLLTDLGYDVTAQAGAVAALDVLEASSHSEVGSGQGPFDLLIADIELHGVNGLELATRALRRWPTLRVLLISGQAGDTPERQTIVRLGLPFLSKPFDKAALDSAVRLALSPSLA